MCGRFLRTWSAHFVGFFQYICETRTSSHRSFPGGSVSHAQVQLIICQSQQETPFFSAFVELNNKIEHVLQRGRLGSSLQASVPRYWIRRLPPPPYLFSAWLFAFTIKRHLHYLLEKQQKKWESKPVWPLGGGTRSTRFWIHRGLSGVNIQEQSCCPSRLRSKRPIFTTHEDAFHLHQPRSNTPNMWKGRDASVTNTQSRKQRSWGCTECASVLGASSGVASKTCRKSKRLDIKLQISPPIAGAVEYTPPTVWCWCFPLSPPCSNSWPSGDFAFTCLFRQANIYQTTAPFRQAAINSRRPLPPDFTIKARHCWPTYDREIKTTVNIWQWVRVNCIWLCRFIHIRAHTIYEDDV